MVKVKNNGPMVLNMRATIKVAKKMDSVSSYGQTSLAIRVSSMRIIFMV